MTDTFRCGHARVAENAAPRWMSGRLYWKCRHCYNAKMRRYMAAPKAPAALKLHDPWSDATPSQRAMHSACIDERLSRRIRAGHQ